MTVSKREERRTSAAGDTASVLSLPYRLVFLSTPDCPRWYTQLYRTIARSSAYATLCADADAYEDAIARHQPDALIGYDGAPCDSLFTSLVLIEMAHRPVCVLVARGEPESEMPADLLCSPSARSLRRQIQTVLDLRRDLQQTQRQVDDLTRRLATTQRTNEQKRARLQAEHEDRAKKLAAENSQLRARVETLEREAAESAALKQAIFNSMAHEFNTPLLQVKGSVIQLGYSDPDNSVIQMAISAFAKLEAGFQNMQQLASSMEIKLAPVVVREIIDAATRKVINSLIHKDSGNRIHVEMADRLPPVLGDSKSLVTVMHRLLDNALKFSKDTPVEVRARLDGELVAVSVQDYGIGIDEAEYGRIFDMFYQIDGSDAKRYGGMGVGLAIVRTILDKHDVQISVRSQPGQGTVFTFHLKPVKLTHTGQP